MSFLKKYCLVFRRWYEIFTLCNIRYLIPKSILTLSYHNFRCCGILPSWQTKGSPFLRHQHSEHYEQSWCLSLICHSLYKTFLHILYRLNPALGENLSVEHLPAWLTSIMLWMETILLFSTIYTWVETHQYIPFGGFPPGYHLTLSLPCLFK